MNSTYSRLLRGSDAPQGSYIMNLYMDKIHSTFCKNKLNKTPPEYLLIQNISLTLFSVIIAIIVYNKIKILYYIPLITKISRAKIIHLTHITKPNNKTIIL